MNRFKERLSNLIGSKGVRSIATVLSGAALAQLISLAVSPIISRIYSPEIYGLMGAFYAVLFMVSTLAGLTYPSAIVQSKHQDEAKALATLSIIVGFGLSVLMGGIVFFWKDDIANEFRLQGIGNLIYVMPFAVLFESIYQAGQQSMIRSQMYGLTAKINFFQSLSGAILKIGGGLIAPSGYMLVGTSLFSVPFNAISIYYILNKGFCPTRWPAPIDLSKLKALAIEYIDFPIYRAPQTLLASLGQNFPPLVIIQIMGIKAAGLYSMSNALLGLPVQLLSKTVYDVFMVKLSIDVIDGKRILGSFTKASFALALVSAPPFLIVLLLGPWLFGFTLGEKWVEAGEFARWGTLISFTTIVSRPSNCILSVLRRQDLLFAFETANLVIRVAAMLFAAFFFPGHLNAIAAFSISGAIVNVAQICLSFAFARARDESIVVKS